jgi:hypothetical protein
LDFFFLYINVKTKGEEKGERKIKKQKKQKLPCDRYIDVPPFFAIFID